MVSCETDLGRGDDLVRQRNTEIIDTIVVHCSATPPDAYIGAEEIRRWHVQERGWDDIGYHYVIRRNGDVEKGRPLNIVGAHVLNYNNTTIGICLIGGLKDSSSKTPEANFTYSQYTSLVSLLTILQDTVLKKSMRVVGHRDLDKGKDCPCFNVKELLGELKQMNLDNADFEEWFDTLQMHLSDRGIQFTDKEAVREDYLQGKNVFDVVDEIAAEYGE